MMLIENVNDQKNANRSVTMTHEIKGTGARTEHFIRIYRPTHQGPFAGELVASYVLSADQAKELKNHL